MIDIDNKIKDDINEYIAEIKINIDKDYSVYQPIYVSFQENDNDLKLIKLLIEQQNEGYVYTKTPNSSIKYKNMLGKISTNVDRYGRIILNNDVSVVDNYTEFWRKSVGYEYDILFYIDYNECFLQKLFQYCSYPNFLTNPRSILGSRIETIRKKVEKYDNIFVVSLSYNQKSLLFFAKKDIQRKILKIALDYSNWSEGNWRETSWQSLMKEKYHVDSRNSLLPFILAENSN